MSINLGSESCYLYRPLKREPTRLGKALQQSRKNIALQVGWVGQFYLKKIDFTVLPRNQCYVINTLL
jgi:hypothetical protein